MSIVIPDARHCGQLPQELREVLAPNIWFEISSIAVFYRTFLIIETTGEKKPCID